MKKLQSLLLLGFLMILAACSNDELIAPDAPTGQTITVTIPGSDSRAIADYGQGKMVNRCILDIYHGNDTERYSRHIATVTDGKATFTDLRLVASQTYDFVFWADCADGENDKYFDTSDLQKISFKDYTGNQDAFDAFFKTETFTVTEAFTKTVELRRPFGQLNIKTLDIDQIFKDELKPASVKVEFTAVPTEFNARSGEVGNEQAVAYTAPVEDAATGEISVDYIFANVDEASLQDFAITLINKDNKVITKNEDFKNIPIRRNYRTNITGNLLTKQGAFNVEVNPLWDGDVPVVIDGAVNVTTGAKYYSLQAAVDAASANDVIRIWGTLDEDVTVNKSIKIEGGSDDASESRVRTIDFADGIDVTCENIEIYGFLTHWNSADETFGSYLANVNSATFKNCRFTQDANEALALSTYFNATGKLTFDGCFFGAQPRFQQLAANGSLTILNSDFQAWGAQIEPANYINHKVEGNTFKTVHFTAASGATNAEGLSGIECLFVNELLANNTFTDDTKKVKVWPTGFYVNDIIPTAYNKTTNTVYTSLKDALSNAKSGETIFASGMTSAEDLTVPAGVTLDGAGNSVFSGKLFVAQGATLRNLSSEWGGTGTRQAIMVQGSNVTLENLTIAYKGKEAKSEAIVTYAGADNLTVKDCAFSGYWKGIYLNSTKELKIEGCDFLNMNPFSMDEYDASMQVTGNTFRRTSLFDAQMPHFIATKGMDNSTKYAESWSLDLKKTVYALFTENTWVGSPRIRVQYTGTSAWDNTNVTPATFNSGNLKNAQNVFVNRDRYQPSAVEFLSSYENKSAVLHYTLDSRTAQSNRDAVYQGHFYNTQGRHFEVFNPAKQTKWEVSGDIYVDAAMITAKKPFRSELWTASANAATGIAEYPMLGIANVVEDAGGIYQSAMDHAVARIWGENGWENVEGVPVSAGWHTVKMVSDGSNVLYYFDGQKVGQYASEATPIYLNSVMPEAFHYDYKHSDGRTFYANYTCETYFCNVTYKLK